MTSRADRPGRAGVSRRNFVRASAATAAAGAFLSPALASGRRSSLASVKVGLIGCGGRGTGAITQALNADPNAILTAIADAFPERVDACMTRLEGNDQIVDKLHAQKKDRFHGFDAYKQLIDSGVDVVVLATPPVFRPEHLRYAIERGKHVFCEKPVAVDAPGIRSVLETARLAKEKNLSLVSGFCWRYSLPQRAFWNRVIDGSHIGDVRAIQTTYNTGPLGNYSRQPGESDMEWQLRNWKAFIWSSGDHIVEQGIHAIDWIHWGMNNRVPARAWGVGGRQCRSGEATGNLWDHFSIVYEYEDGARGYHTCRQIENCDNDNTAYVLGANGTGTSNPWNPRSIRFEGDNAWRYDGPNNSMYQQEHDELFASIRNGKPMNDGEWMAHSTMMGIMGRMVAYTGRTLSWEQCLNSEERLTPEAWDWGDRAFPEVPMPNTREYR